MIMGRSIEPMMNAPMTSARGRSLCVVLAALATLVVATTTSTARADEKGTITLKTTTVVGSAKRPSVVIEVSRAKPEIKLADLQDPAVEKIVRAASKAPF
jgi:hypothetical protein